MSHEAPIETLIERWVDSTTTISDDTPTEELKSFVKSALTLFKWTMDRFEVDSKKLQKANQEIQKLKINLTQVRETITNYAAMINTLQVAINHIQPEKHSTKNKKIPYPTPYSSSRDELRNFLNSLKLKLIEDAAKFPAV